MSIPAGFILNAPHSIPVFLVRLNDYAAWLEKQDHFTKNWLNATHIQPEKNSGALIPNAKGELSHVLCLIDANPLLRTMAKLPLQLPEGIYHLESLDEGDKTQALVGWGLGSYQFTRYKKAKRKPAQLALREPCPDLFAAVEADHLVRDLINTPTEDMGPAELAHAAETLAKRHAAEIQQIVGDDLLAQGLNAIHAVGRASAQAPRLIQLKWGDPKARRITLVGKGVCFDSGGLDIKPPAGMLLMKKDMSGAAHVLGLAHLIMSAKLPIHLHVVIPAVENSISSNAYRPGDVIKMHQGKTVEITNTDAEGRLILADAISVAVKDKPELLIDIATLTGAAKVAVGAEIASFFCNDDEVAAKLAEHAEPTADPLWRMPLYAPYLEYLKSNIADLANAASVPYAGAITAALFLESFITDGIKWAHFDIMGWADGKNGHALGAETSSMRAIFGFLKGLLKS